MRVNRPVHHHYPLIASIVLALDKACVRLLASVSQELQSHAGCKLGTHVCLIVHKQEVVCSSTGAHQEENEVHRA